MRSIGKLLAVVLIGACAGTLLISEPRSQVPFVQFVFPGDPFWTNDSSGCKPPFTLDTLEVVAYNFNTSFVGADLRVVYPPALQYYQDIVDATLWIGNSIEGLAIVWQTPRNGFEPVVLFRVQVLWTEQCDCHGTPQHVFVVPYPGNLNPTFVRWPDYAQFPAVGMYSEICRTPPVPIRSTTWGGIKALYR
jgi:hypothetical protein